MIAPGRYDYEKKFASDVHHKMHFGGKYKFEPLGKGNPALTTYSPQTSYEKIAKNSPALVGRFEHMKSLCDKWIP